MREADPCNFEGFARRCIDEAKAGPNDRLEAVRARDKYGAMLLGKLLEGPDSDAIDGEPIAGDTANLSTRLVRHDSQADV